MTITIIPTVAAFSGTPPTTADPSSFDSRADALLPFIATTLPDSLALFAAAANEMAGQVELEAAGVHVAAVSANLAAEAATLSAGGNFKGVWSSLTGALAIPATVAHNGLIWVLLNGVGNVATAVPGVSAAWQCLQKGVVQVVAASASAAFSTSSTSYVDTGLSASITPLSVASRVVVIVMVSNFYGQSNAAYAQVFRGATALPESLIWVNSSAVNAGTGAPADSLSRSISALDLPASTSAQTYSLKTKAGAGGFSTFGRVNATPDTMLLMEVL